MKRAHILLLALIVLTLLLLACGGGGEWQDWQNDVGRRQREGLPTSTVVVEISP
jgi:hypothetical protein